VIDQPTPVGLTTVSRLCSGCGRERVSYVGGQRRTTGLVVVRQVPRAATGRPLLYLGVLVDHAVHHEAEQEHAGHGDELGTRLEVVLAGVVDGGPKLLLPTPGGQLARQFWER